MSALLHEIIERPDTYALASPEHFVLGPGEPVSARIVVEDRNWSLFTFDQQGQRALFVELPEGTDLSQAAFCRLDQHQLAQRVLSVPFDELEALADDIPAPENIVFVFSIGRCGSTLVSKIFNQIENVWSLSEPDPYPRLLMNDLDLRERLDYPRDQAVWLIKMATRFLFRPPPQAKATTYAVKFRSQCLFQADLYYEAFPQAKFIFLYRNAIDWADSFYQIIQRLGEPTVFSGDERDRSWNILTAASDIKYLTPYVDITTDTVRCEQILVPAWALILDEYMKYFQAGVPFFALRYDELNADRVGSLQALLTHCGLSPEAVDAALAAFRRDSQEGTNIAKTIAADRLSETARTGLREILAKHPRFGSPDARVPDIYRPDLTAGGS